MATNDSNRIEVHNGFTKVTRIDFEAHCHIAMDACEKIATLGYAIDRLVTNDLLVSRLTKQLISLAEELENEADVIRENVVKAGLIEYHSSYNTNKTANA